MPHRSFRRHIYTNHKDNKLDFRNYTLCNSIYIWVVKIYQNNVKTKFTMHNVKVVLQRSSSIFIFQLGNPKLRWTNSINKGRGGEEVIVVVNRWHICILRYSCINSCMCHIISNMAIKSVSGILAGVQWEGISEREINLAPFGIYYHNNSFTVSRICKLIIILIQ